MKYKILILLAMLPLLVDTGFSQGKSGKELKNEKRLEKRSDIETLVNSKEFKFVARIAMPSGMGSVDLTSNPNYIKFHPEFIDSYMPFFGTAYGSVGYGGDTGLKFRGKPDRFTIDKRKNGYQVDAAVKGEADNFNLSLFVGSEGNASLTITSNNRSVISYQGEISAPDNKP